MKSRLLEERIQFWEQELDQAAHQGETCVIEAIVLKELKRVRRALRGKK